MNLESRIKRLEHGTGEMRSGCPLCVSAEGRERETVRFDESRFYVAETLKLNAECPACGGARPIKIELLGRIDEHEGDTLKER